MMTSRTDRSIPRDVGATALVAEPDPAVRKKICEGLEELGYLITTPATAKEALKAMRFHIFDVIILNELFDTKDSRTNAVLSYLENMAMSTRRRFFVALVRRIYQTMDRMPHSTGASIWSSISRVLTASP